MGLIRAAAILAIDNRFRTPSLELKGLGTSFGAQKQNFSIPRDSAISLQIQLGVNEKPPFYQRERANARTNDAINYA